MKKNKITIDDMKYMSVKVCEKEGQKAKTNGKSQKNNPYPFGSDFYWAWFGGFMKGDRVL